MIAIPLVQPGHQWAGVDQFAEKACAHTEGLDPAGFTASGINYDATLRNRLIHGYPGIDNDTLWSVIKADIPALLPQLQELGKRAG